MPLRFRLPAVMLAMFVLLAVFYRGDQAAWERINKTTVVELHESETVADLYEGYQEPEWIDVFYFLESIPGLLPVRVFTDPLPLYTKAKWWIYGADLLSIALVWFTIGLCFDVPQAAARFRAPQTLPLL